MVLMCAGMSVAAVMLMLLVYLLLERYLTSKRLKEHQRAWDATKAELTEKGFSEKEIDDAYIDYLDRLMLDRNTLLGACFPRR